MMIHQPCMNSCGRIVSLPAATLWPYDLLKYRTESLLDESRHRTADRDVHADADG